jgi:hypothetical protein
MPLPPPTMWRPPSPPTTSPRPPSPLQCWPAPLSPAMSARGHGWHPVDPEEAHRRETPQKPREGHAPPPTPAGNIYYILLGGVWGCDPSGGQQPRGTGNGGQRRKSKVTEGGMGRRSSNVRMDAGPQRAEVRLQCGGGGEGVSSGVVGWPEVIVGTACAGAARTSGWTPGQSARSGRRRVEWKGRG